MKRTGQATLEYAIILAIIIVAIVAIGRTIFQANLTTALSNASNRIGTEAEGLSQ